MKRTEIWTPEQHEKRKAWDRENSKKKYTKYKELRKEALDKLGGKCILCEKNNDLHLHHIEYHADSDYPRTGSGWSRIRRVTEALENPERFKLLCSGCHQSITTISRIIKKAGDLEIVISLLPKQH